MPNNWFKFKKFTIRQDKTAMKVGTDGVLLGAWSDVSGCQRILDIGTGTGLIALMLAQRSSALIDAIEIDSDAAKQAAENVEESPWSDKINVFHTSFQDFCKTTTKTYDLIVCNPPYFSDSLRSGNDSRSVARHDDQLSINEIISGTIAILNSDGHLCIILPAEKEDEMIATSEESDLFPSTILRIRPVPEKPLKRVLIDFTFSNAILSEMEIVIENGLRHQYSREYFELTKDFYLFNQPEHRCL